MDKLESVLSEAVDFASGHPIVAMALTAAYVWLLLAMLEPIERP